MMSCFSQKIRNLAGCGCRHHRHHWSAATGISGLGLASAIAALTAWGTLSAEELEEASHDARGGPSCVHKFGQLRCEIDRTARHFCRRVKPFFHILIER